MTYYYKHTLAYVLIISLLVGCTPSQDLLTSADRLFTGDEGPQDLEKIPDYIDPYQRLTRDDYKNTLLPRHKKAEKKENDIPKLSSAISDPKPAPLANGKLVSLSVTDDIPLKDVLIELSRLADIDLELDPRITGGIILRVKDKPVEQVIERVARLGKLRYEVQDGVLRVQRDLPYTVHYPATFLNLTRSNTGTVSVSTAVLGGGGSSGGDSGSSSDSGGSDSGSSSGGEGLSSGSQNNISSQYDGDLWTAVEEGITSLLAQMENAEDEAAEEDENLSDNPLDPNLVQQSSQSTGATAGGSAISINRQAGIITVTANKVEHDKVREYIERVKRSVTSQVLIEAKVVEITLDDEYRSGINWNLTDDNLQLATEGNFINAIAGQDSLFTISGLSRTPIGNLEAAISFTEKFGTTRTISSPRLLATNNQQAVLTFAENQIYFSLTLEESTEDNTNGTTENNLTIESEINSVPIGVILTLQPSIDLDSNEIMMNIRPTLSRVTSQISDPGTTLIARRNNITDITSDIPVVEVREMDSVLKIRNGQVMVIGGLMEERTFNNDQGIPGVSKIPMVGNLFKTVEKTTQVIETVIFLKATIVSGAHTDPHDRKIYDTFTNDPRPLAF